MAFPGYPFQEIEARQRAAWAAQPASPAPAESELKHFALTLPIVPGSAAGSFSELRRFVIADLHARLQRGQGGRVRLAASWNGFDAAIEKRARETGKRPAEIAERDREALRALLGDAAVTIDSQVETDLHRHEAYRWTQWLFIQLLQRKLVARRLPVADLPASPEGAAPREAARAAEKRGGRWMVDLSPFGDRLLNDLDRTNWPVREKKEQRHRIGRRRGSEVLFQVSHAFRMEVEELAVFTTQVEAIYGATFILIDPRHPILPAVLDPSYEEDVARYRDRLAKGSEPRISGARTGGFALNPANLKRIPVLVSALAMDAFSGGAILGVPGHDPEQFELARRLYLPIREAIRGPGARYDLKGALKEAYTGDGTLTNSSIFSGLPVRVARERIISYLGRREICSRVTRFRFHQLPLSVAGTWGAPVPVVHCPRCGEVPVPEEALPVLLPAGAAPASGGGGGAGAEPPDLRSLPGFSQTPCPSCSGPAKRDSHVIAPWLGESIAHLLSKDPELAALGEDRGAAPAIPAPAQSETAGSAPAAGAGASAPETSPAEGERPREAEAGDGPSPGPGGALAASEEEPDEWSDLSAARAEPLPEDAERAKETTPREVLPEDRELFPEGPAREPRKGRGGREAEEHERSSPARAARADGESAAAASDAPAPAGEEGPEEEEEEEDEAPAPVVFESRFHPFRRDEVRRWLPADAAFGRAGQGVLSLLYLRSITKFLNDIGEIEFTEPFYRYLRVGSVRPPAAPPGTPPGRASPPRAEGPRATRPSSDPTPATPSEAIQRYGADAVRLALIGLSAPHRDGTIDGRALHGAQRFLDRVLRQVTLRIERGKFVSRAVLETKHRMIHDTTQRLKRFKFHTALAALREFQNFLEAPTTTLEEMDRSALRTYLIVLSPFAPHLAEELWGRLGETGSVRSAPWPEANRELLRSPEREVPVRVDGRICHRLKVSGGLEREKLEALAIKEERVQAALAGRPVLRVIAVADRVVNFLTELKAPPPSSAGQDSPIAAPSPPASPSSSPSAPSAA